MLSLIASWLVIVEYFSCNHMKDLEVDFTEAGHTAVHAFFQRASLNTTSNIPDVLKLMPYISIQQKHANKLHTICP